MQKQALLLQSEDLKTRVLFSNLHTALVISSHAVLSLYTPVCHFSLQSSMHQRSPHSNLQASASSNSDQVMLSSSSQDLHAVTGGLGPVTTLTELSSS